MARRRVEVVQHHEAPVEFEEPAASMLWLEARVVLEFAALTMMWPLLAAGSRGDGHPVVVLPPFGASDHATLPLRSLLTLRGHRTHGWGLGTNWGRTSELVEAVPERFRQLHERYDQPLSLVGWSHGGIWAREIARDQPEWVRQVITLASPFRHHPDDHSGSRFAHLMHTHPQVPHRAAFRAAERGGHPLPVPTTAIYSRTDGVANWRACTGSDGVDSESIEVPSTHIGMGVNPLVVGIIADRLAQRVGHWRPFSPG